MDRITQGGRLIESSLIRFCVWAYFLFSLIGEQQVETPSKDENENNLENTLKYIPIFPIVRFIFFTGWLKVTEAIENPFGSDDDDFHDLSTKKKTFLLQAS